ncbi:transposase [Acutalibacter caecimuris]|uniref:transposase n=1 Tax=Acutalibacter caecimuris TaxID=3093657 RepID=UPI002AC90FDD|nr:transposase [Acutalibacter sp. M00118]
MPKLHAIAEGLGNLTAFFLSAGNDHDFIHTVELLDKLEISDSHVLADCAYGAQSIRDYILEHGSNYIIPPQSNIAEPWPVGWYLYKERHLIECFFQKIKWFRRIATRYDKPDVSFLACVHFAAIAIFLI